MALELSVQWLPEQGYRTFRAEQVRVNTDARDPIWSTRMTRGKVERLLATWPCTRPTCHRAAGRRLERRLRNACAICRSRRALRPCLNRDRLLDATRPAKNPEIAGERGGIA